MLVEKLAAGEAPAPGLVEVPVEEPRCGIAGASRHRSSEPRHRRCGTAGASISSDPVLGSVERQGPMRHELHHAHHLVNSSE